jgi:hypothetical protein
MINLDPIEPGWWVSFVTDPHTGVIIKIKIESREENGQPSLKPSDELLAQACHTAENACIIRDRMSEMVHSWASDPDFLELLAENGVLGEFECSQDLIEFFAQTGLTPVDMSKDELLNPDFSDLLRLKEIPKLVFLHLEQTKGLSKFTNICSEIFIRGYFVDSWTHLWYAGDGYVDGPYSLYLPKNYQPPT